jgi:hypothetical protein
MSTTKHTPGPWTAGRDDMATVIEGFDGKYIYAGEKYVAAAVGIDIEDWDEVMANARLIAAAPETKRQRDALLKALKECERYFTAIDMASPDKKRGLIGNRVRDITRNTIAECEKEGN